MAVLAENNTIHKSITRSPTTDMGSHTFTYNYNYAELVSSQTGSTGQTSPTATTATAISVKPSTLWSTSTSSKATSPAMR